MEERIEKRKEYVLAEMNVIELEKKDVMTVSVGNGGIDGGSGVIPGGGSDDGSGGGSGGGIVLPDIPIIPN